MCAHHEAEIDEIAPQGGHVFVSDAQNGVDLLLRVLPSRIELPEQVAEDDQQLVAAGRNLLEAGADEEVMDDLLLAAGLRSLGWLLPVPYRNLWLSPPAAHGHPHQGVSGPPRRGQRLDRTRFDPH